MVADDEKPVEDKAAEGINLEGALPEAGAICRLLTDTWTLLRTDPVSLPLPDKVLLFPLTETRGRPSNWLTFGHFAPSRWTTTGDGGHEVALHPGLFSEPEDLLLVLLHEAAHALLLDQNLGCSPPGGYYHRKNFRDQCLEMGLLCDWVDTRHGWNRTRWPDGAVPLRYRPALEYLRDRLQSSAVEKVRPSDQPGVPLPEPGRIKLECQCPKPRTVYAARGVAARGGIRCDLCQKVFSRAVPALVSLDDDDDLF